MSNLHLISFGDSRMRRSQERIEKQAAELKVFKSVSILNENDLAPDFRLKHIDKLVLGSRGFGYWVWKPHIVRRKLENLDEDDVLLYTDIGCWLNKNGKQQLLRYVEKLRDSSHGVAAFQNIFSRDKNNMKFYSLPECNWTKPDVFDHFSISESDVIYKSEQIFSTAFFVKNNNAGRQVISNWENLYNESFFLFDDNYRRKPDVVDFGEHRHDQSIFSILLKLNGYVALNAFDCFYPDYRHADKPLPKIRSDWSKITNSPIQFRRDKDLGLGPKAKKYLSNAYHKILSAKDYKKMKNWS